MPGEKILVVEDSPELLSFLGGNVLPYHGYQVVTATNGQEGLSKLSSQEPDLLLLDLELPDMSGIDILKTMPRDVGDTPVILMTAFGSESIAVEAFRLGVKDYIIKPFTSEEVGNAIERALTETRLRKEKEQLTQSLRQRVQELTILSAVGKSVVSLMDLEELLNRIVEAGVEVTKAEEGFLLLVDPNTKDLCLRAGKNLGELQARGFRLKVADTLAGEVVKTGKPVRHGGGETGRDFKLKTGYLVKSLLHVPLILRERAIGVLSVDNQVSDREFSQGDQHLLCTLADYAAVSIENATLYNELRKSIDELKRSQQGLIQSSKLAALGRLTASLAHEINNPLQAIRSCISILANRSLDQDKREKYLGIADKELARLAQLVDRMLDFHRPSMGSRGLTDVNALLEDTLTLVSKQLQHSDVTLSTQLTPDLPPIAAAASHLRQVFINLVINAVEAMPEGGALAVSTGLDMENDQLVMVFSDTGVGIPADILPYIFEPFYTTKSSGTGLGLSISYAIVEQQGGGMEVKSVEGEGATFTVRLPLNGERDA
jgi:two-component system NtrC family sensor kinase